MKIDHDTLIAYAMGMLSEKEMLSVEEHLKTNPDDALEVKRYLNALSAVVMTEEPEIVPWVAKQNLLTRVRAEGDTKQTLQAAEAKAQHEAEDKDNSVGNVVRLEPTSSTHPNRKYQWRLGFAVAASIAAFALYSPVTTWYNNIQLNQQLVNSIKQSGAVSTSLVDDKNQSIGTLVKQSDNSLFVVLNEKLSNEQVYQAWNIVDGKPQSLGIYQKGVIQVTGFDSGNIFGITIEPAGGSDQPTSTPIVIYEL